MLDAFPSAVSSYAAELDDLIRFIWWIVAAWFVAAEAILVYLLIRYRRRKGVRAGWMPATSWKACAWVLVPTFFVFLFDIAIETRSTKAWEAIKIELPDHDVLVRITGRQFVWTFQYAGEDGVLDTADDFDTVGEMHVPAGKVVRFQLESHDVLHSFWVPVLRLKQDAVPGRSIPGWFNAEKTGVYEIACAELCGAAHTSMRALLTVEEDEAFATWSTTLAEQQALQGVAKAP